MFFRKERFIFGCGLYAAMQSRKAVSIHCNSSREILPFGFTEHYVHFENVNYLCYKAIMPEILLAHMLRPINNIVITSFTD